MLEEKMKIVEETKEQQRKREEEKKEEEAGCKVEANIGNLTIGTLPPPKS